LRAIAREIDTAKEIDMIQVRPHESGAARAPGHAASFR